MHITHAMVAATMGELSLALQRKSATRRDILKWIRSLRAAADRLESKLAAQTEAQANAEEAPSE